MRVVILTNKQSNQVALANKIAGLVQVEAVVVSHNIPKRAKSRRFDFARLLNSVANRTVGREFVQAWLSVLERYEDKYSSFPTENIFEVENVNDELTSLVIQETEPELVIVSGTNIVGSRLIKQIKKNARIINLHTGISPYVKGGPNCTNWCLANGWFHLIGNTVMELDAGIDTGNVIVTERTRLNGDENLALLHWKVMEHAHDLYIRVISRFAEGVAVSATPQNLIADGKLFYNRQWNAFEIIRAKRNFVAGFRPYFKRAAASQSVSADIRLISLNDD